MPKVNNILSSITYDIVCKNTLAEVLITVIIGATEYSIVMQLMY